MKRMKNTRRPTMPANREGDRSDSIKGIRRGLVQATKGLGRPADEVFDALERDADDKFVSVATRRILERSDW
jgi:hypothetical protein